MSVSEIRDPRRGCPPGSLRESGLRADRLRCAERAADCRWNHLPEWRTSKAQNHRGCCEQQQHRKAANEMPRRW